MPLALKEPKGKDLGADGKNQVSPLAWTVQPIQMRQSEWRECMPPATLVVLGHLVFEFVSDFDIRISSFHLVIRED